MDVPPTTPAPAGGDAVSVDAYEQFWDCLESDAPSGDDVTAADDVPADAYGQFWQQAE
jgi:hypothetical protein